MTDKEIKRINLIHEIVGQNSIFTRLLLGLIVDRGWMTREEALAFAEEAWKKAKAGDDGEALTILEDDNVR